jgi:hypothetical protein
VTTSNEIINTTVQFLQRATLQGNEVPAFIQVMNWLTELQKELNAPPQETSDG